ncbi:hypothetical protein [Chitinophaga solisilvae]|uniref:Uncharacterized protein n=1 Tax=Chitinophaga solisilvae TaxID=1233460 RepID=A0A3S1D3T2_9BACT|nr:hypothetical protein [Chitinophaga solisilvae]NSL90198.1 hypothetical protein [Chitinophaga solisilvae]
MKKQAVSQHARITLSLDKEIVAKTDSHIMQNLSSTKMYNSGENTTVSTGDFGWTSFAQATMATMGTGTSNL